MGRHRLFFDPADEQSEVHANLSDVTRAGWTITLEQDAKVILARCQFASVIRQ
jgi:hypothetical protein